jgi:hypothetical protein
VSLCGAPFQFFLLRLVCLEATPAGRPAARAQLTPTAQARTPARAGSLVFLQQRPAFCGRATPAGAPSFCPAVPCASTARRLANHLVVTQPAAVRHGSHKHPSQTALRPQHPAGSRRRLSGTFAHALPHPCAPTPAKGGRPRGGCPPHAAMRNARTHHHATPRRLFCGGRPAGPAPSREPPGRRPPAPSYVCAARPALWSRTLFCRQAATFLSCCISSNGRARGWLGPAAPPGGRASPASVQPAARPHPAPAARFCPGLGPASCPAWPSCRPAH